MRMSSMRGFALCATMFVSACSSSYQFGNPEEHVPGSDGAPVWQVVKAIRCELVTFLQTNRERKRVFDQTFNKPGGIDDAHRYLDLNDAWAAGIYVALKVIETENANGSITRKIPYRNPTKALSWFVGPGFNNSRAYEMDQAFALAQSANLYSEPNETNPDFFCYSVAPQGDLATLEALTHGQMPEREQFHRIYVGGDGTLAAWLENIAIEMSRNYLTKVPQSELVYPGQLAYSFGIDVKASIEGRFTLIAHYWNPLIPDLFRLRKRVHLSLY